MAKDKIETFRPLSASEKKVVAYLKKIDKLAAEPDFNAIIFGNAGYDFRLLLNGLSEEDSDRELYGEILLKKTIAFKSEHLKGDGGDLDFRD